MFRAVEAGDAAASPQKIVG